MNAKPVFTDEITVEEFDLHYWYKSELQNICRKHGLSADGTKAELEESIRAFLLGSIHHNVRIKTTKARKSSASKNPISLQTKLINDGFRFNNEARIFFANYFNVAKFSFTKEMAVALREAEKNQNYEMTVADLIAIYQNKNSNGIIETSCDEKSYQWNNFVKDFNNDSKSNQFNQRMKVAAILWGKVRDNPVQKKYDSSLIDNYFSAIEKYCK